MANNYVSSSSEMTIPKEKREQAIALCQEIEKEIENGEDGFCCVKWKVEADHIWFYDDDGFDSDHLSIFADRLVEELKLEEPFFASWSYTCDKPRVNEFGGGALVKQLGQPVYFVDAMEHVMSYVER
jgi:hypothetical protein